jgi:hypothetical protein
MANEKYIDMTIKCEAREWHVHKAIVCPSSSVIANGFDKGFKEGVKGIFEIKEFDADTVDRTIHYMYKRSYEVTDKPAVLEAPEAAVEATEQLAGGSEAVDQKDESNNINDVLLAHINVFAIAHFYDIQTLMVHATEQFEATKTRGLDIDGFVDVIKAIYERGCNRPLKQHLLEYAYHHRLTLTANQEFLDALAAEHTPENELHSFTIALLQKTTANERLDTIELERHIKQKYSVKKKKKKPSTPF